MKILIFIIILLILCIFNYYITNNEHYQNDNKSSLFNSLMNNHYGVIFPNNANRNSAGFRFFKYIYDNLATTEELFDTYNMFYCAVSGSIVSPDRSNNYDILKVKDLEGNCVIGKYYRCCTPCNCDIMKYTRVVNTSIELPKGSGNYVNKKLLTIGDPCEKHSESSFPPEIDRNVFKCNSNKLELGYRVKDNKLTSDSGRLVIGVLYDVSEDEKTQFNSVLQNCRERLDTNPEDLKYGMGDIFVKLSLLNQDNAISNVCN